MAKSFEFVDYIVPLTVPTPKCHKYSCNLAFIFFLIFPLVGSIPDIVFFSSLHLQKRTKIEMWTRRKIAGFTEWESTSGGRPKWVTLASLPGEWIIPANCRSIAIIINKHYHNDLTINNLIIVIASQWFIHCVVHTMSTVHTMAICKGNNSFQIIYIFVHGYAIGIEL